MAGLNRKGLLVNKHGPCGKHRPPPPFGIACLRPRRIDEHFVLGLGPANAAPGDQIISNTGLIKNRFRLPAHRRTCAPPRSPTALLEAPDVATEVIAAVFPRLGTTENLCLAFLSIRSSLAGASRRVAGAFSPTGSRSTVVSL